MGYLPRTSFRWDKTINESIKILSEFILLPDSNIYKHDKLHDSLKTQMDLNRDIIDLKDKFDAVIQDITPNTLSTKPFPSLPALRWDGTAQDKQLGEDYNNKKENIGKYFDPQYGIGKYVSTLYNDVDKKIK